MTLGSRNIYCFQSWWPNLQDYLRGRPSPRYDLCWRSRSWHWHLPGRLWGSPHSSGEILPSAGGFVLARWLGSIICYSENHWNGLQGVPECFTFIPVIDIYWARRKGLLVGFSLESRTQKFINLSRHRLGCMSWLVQWAGEGTVQRALGCMQTSRVSSISYQPIPSFEFPFT